MQIISRICISDYKYSKLFKRRMYKLAEEEEEEQPELEKVEEQPLDR
jgi:hypothetical protein